MDLRLIVPALAAVGLGVWGVNKWSYGRTHESTDNAQVEGHIVPIVAKVGGYVLSVNAGEYAAIAANAELAEIDDREYAARAGAGGVVSRKQVEVGQLVQPRQTLMSVGTDALATTRQAYRALPSSSFAMSRVSMVRTTMRVP